MLGKEDLGGEVVLFSIEKDMVGVSQLDESRHAAFQHRLWPGA